MAAERHAAAQRGRDDFVLERRLPEVTDPRSQLRVRLEGGKLLVLVDGVAVECVFWLFVCRVRVCARAAAEALTRSNTSPPKPKGRPSCRKTPSRISLARRSPPARC